MVIEAALAASRAEAAVALRVLGRELGPAAGACCYCEQAFTANDVGRGELPAGGAYHASCHVLQTQLLSTMVAALLAGRGPLGACHAGPRKGLCFFCAQEVVSFN